MSEYERIIDEKLSPCWREKIKKKSYNENGELHSTMDKAVEGFGAEEDGYYLNGSKFKYIEWLYLKNKQDFKEIVKTKDSITYYLENEKKYIKFVTNIKEVYIFHYNNEKELHNEEKPAIEVYNMVKDEIKPKSYYLHNKEVTKEEIALFKEMRIISENKNL